MRYPIEFIHPLYGKLYVSSYIHSINIHLHYQKQNDIELSRKWLDISMKMYDKPKYIRYKYL